ncbi:hypothetical protein H8B09_24295 [Paenibacillus sp. PR3]|uniref:Uncharacterized protein n=1 Tax=Paenibacillus terricola TaxID=2763503 RepID=A0ABR8N608_9BACL|nr:hypothetical protein [Paenibacillus terricola]MBD3921904.1 hypothetical protein [Paenibacillus terricola]
MVNMFGEILGQEDIAADYIAKYQADQQAGKEKLSGLNGLVAFVQVRDDGSSNGRLERQRSMETAQGS